jgi:hypothetical protein
MVVEWVEGIPFVGTFCGRPIVRLNAAPDELSLCVSGRGWRMYRLSILAVFHIRRSVMQA